MQGLTIADANGDGKPDLIVANNGPGTLAVLVNKTDVNWTDFEPPQNLPVGPNPVNAHAADLNGDGKPDLIAPALAPGANAVSVISNITAPGSHQVEFSPYQTLESGGRPLSACTADVNGDGRPELITANYDLGAVIVRLNTTAANPVQPGFTAQQGFATGQDPLSVASADFNGDGRNDIAVADFSDQAVSVLLNTTAAGASTPAMAARKPFPAGPNPSTVRSADFNLDGRPDLVGANRTNASVSVLVNDTTRGATTASFLERESHATAGLVHSLTVADLNFDGKPDVVASNEALDSVSVLLNETPPYFVFTSFAAQQPFATGHDPAGVAVADLNADGLPDLVVADAGDANVSVLLNAGAPGDTALSFRPRQGFDTGTQPVSVVVVDLNGDGKPDLAVANQGSASVSLLLNTTAPGATSASFVAQAPLATGVAPTQVVALDANGDGRPDLATANQGDDSVSLLLNATAAGAGVTSFAPRADFAAGDAPASLVATSINGDGNIDLVVGNLDGYTISVLLNSQFMGLIEDGVGVGTIVPSHLFGDGFE